MSVREEVAAGVADALNPLADHVLSRVNKEMIPTLKKEIRSILEGAEINIGGLPVKIKLAPDA